MLSNTGNSRFSASQLLKNGYLHQLRLDCATHALVVRPRCIRVLEGQSRGAFRVFAYSVTVGFTTFGFGPIWPGPPSEKEA